MFVWFQNQQSFVSNWSEWALSSIQVILQKSAVIGIQPLGDLVYQYFQP